MNDDLTWHFDITVIEWLIVLVLLVILAVVGAVVTRQSRKPDLGHSEYIPSDMY